MAWNWGKRKQQTLIRRKPSLEGDGENAEGVEELAKTYIRKGYTRQGAFARARKELGTSYKKKHKKSFRGGGFSPK